MSQKRGRPVETGQANNQKSLKAIILETFDRLGGVDWLYAQAVDDPDKFLPLLRALIPRQIDADLSHEGSIEIRWRGDAPAA